MDTIIAPLLAHYRRTAFQARRPSAEAYGIIGEVIFGMWDSRIQTELRKRSNDQLAVAQKDAADARERAAKLEALTAWRRITPEQANEIIGAIHGGAESLDVLIEYERGDPECFSYARDVAQLFAASGVTKIRWTANSYWETAFGLHLASASQDDRAIVSDALSKADISFIASDRDLSTHLPSNEIAPNLYLFVGPKPPPPLVVSAAGMADGTGAAHVMAPDVNARTAEANQKAQKAALGLARFRSPRSLSRDELYRIAEKMKPFAPMVFEASVNPGDPEYVGCLQFIELALQLAEWEEISWSREPSRMRGMTGLPSIGIGSSVSNVAVFFLVDPRLDVSGPGKNADAAFALAETLTAEGIVAEARAWLAREAPPGATQPRIQIHVGPKR